MDHEPVLISTIAIGLTAAFIGGLIARRLRLPSIVGYIVAGVVVGPFTPGLVADPDIATELAELGVILLMFGVGIHFSIRDLLAVRGIAIPGAVGQIFVATLLGIGLGVALGWGIAGGLVLGLAVSVASTVVLLRALEDRGELDTAQGRVAVGWVIVQDIFTVIVLVALPGIAPLLGAPDADGAAADAVGCPARPRHRSGQGARVRALMIAAGARVVPWLLHLVAREGSRELFTLAVLAIALGIAYVSSTVFGVSFALGAFLAGRRRQRVGHESPGRGRCAAAARRVRGPVLRVGRDAPRPGLPPREPAAGAGHARADRGRQGRSRSSSSSPSPAIHRVSP